MASCQTARWKATSPYVKLTLTQTGSTDTTVTLKYTLQYIADSAASTNGVGRPYTIVIGGATVEEGTYNINGKVGTNTVGNGGSVTINKTTAAQTITFSVSFAFNVTWGGTYGGTKSASGSISVGAKTSYTISYNANGGSGAPASQTKWHGTALTLSGTKPTRTGYAFKGWALTKEAANAGTWYYQPGSSCGRNENTTLYAVWEANTYTVSYNANGGTGAPGNQTKTYGVALTLSSTIPTRTNYTFVGWGTAASATTSSYAPGSQYSDNRDITLYAVWKLAYVKPRIKNVTVERCLSNGSPSDDGTYAKLKFNWECDRQIAKITAQWNNSSGAVESSSVTPSGVSGSENMVFGGSFDVETSYTIWLYVRDAVDYSHTTATLPSKVFPFDVLAGGDGVSVGKPATASKTFDSAWKIKEQGALLCDKYSRKVDLYPNNIQNDYCTTVIGLCDTSPGYTGVDSYSVGRLTVHRINGLNNAVMVDVAMEGAYAAAYGINVSLRQLGWHTEYVPVPVTFTYNGVTYGGLKVRYADAALRHVEFHGASNFNIFAIDYYNSNSGAVLNSEIYNSITEVEHTGMDWSRVLHVSTHLKTPNVRATGNYGIHIGVANNPELAWLYQAGGSTSGSKWFSPKTDAGLLLGASNYRWGQIYSTNSTISASDRDQKKDFAEFDKRYEELFAKLKPQLFKFKNGTSDRKHSGFISQDVETAMLEVGLTGKDFAGFCKDVKQTQAGEDKETGEVFFEDVCDENGAPVYSYSLRYEEFIALNTYMIQKQQSEIEALRNEIQELRKLCSSILPPSDSDECL